VVTTRGRLGGVVEARPDDGLLRLSDGAEAARTRIDAARLDGPNPPAALPKLMVGDQFVIATRARALDPASGAAPGTIAAIDDEEVRVATSGRDLALSGFLSVDGEPLPTAELCARFALYPGRRFDDPDPDVVRRAASVAGAVAEHEQFWIERLADYRPVELPDSWTPLTPAPAGAHRTPPTRSPAVRKLLAARPERGWRADRLLLVALAAYLARVGPAGAFDVLVRGPELARLVAGVESLFAAHVPLRVELDLRETIELAYARIDAALHLAAARRTYSRDLLPRQPALRSVASLRGARAFSVDLVERLGQPDLPDEGLAIAIARDGRVECAEDGRRSDRADALAARLSGWVDAIADDLARPLGEIPLLSAGEARRTLVTWNASAVTFPSRGLIDRLVDARASRQGEAIAVEDRVERLTYRELALRSNRLAAALASRAAGERIVAVLADRSCAFLVAMLAIWKAGGAYLPLDTRDPAARLARVLQEARPTLLLASSAYLGLALEAWRELAPGTVGELLVLEELGRAERQPADRPGVHRSESLAYVIYTSGSTGAPKGAMVEHGGMLNHLRAKVRDLGLTERDVVAQTAPQTFDISVWQFLAPLLVGGRVRIVADDLAYDAASLLADAETGGVTVLETVPSLLRRMLDLSGRPGAGALRWLISTGEALPPELCRRWLTLYPRVALLNGYGPTECSDDVTHFAPDQPPTGTASVPIGRPIANTQLYVLGRGMQPLPIGLAGELYVGGAGVGRGYLGRPDLTAERFVPDPFGSRPGARLYRTGDLARWRSDGQLEFLGRLDHQVKVRGVRIELGEVEATLNDCPDLRACAVTARPGRVGDAELVAYVVPRSPPGPRPGELRRYLAERLPTAMVPTWFVALDQLPLTRSGKVDRARLPAPTGPAVGAEPGSTPPRTPLERALASIWSEVLGSGPLGVEADFFELGGSSLLIAQVLARIRAELGVELSWQAVFDAPTIAELGAIVLRAQVERYGGASELAAESAP
jgi:amino acid adenylation domain-containing protein